MSMIAAAGGTIRPVRGRLRNSPFFTLLGRLMLALAIAGFWPQYFSAVTGRGPAPGTRFWLIHVHAALFILWLLFYISQATLIMTGRAGNGRGLRLHFRDDIRSWWPAAIGARSNFGTSAGILAGLSLLLAGCATPPASQAPMPSGEAELQWRVSCRPGDDGFASNCVASAEASPYSLRVATADSQLSVSILHPTCEEVRRFDRVDVIGLDRSRRAALVADAFADAAATLHKRCPQLPMPAARYSPAPDIAMVGDVD